MKKIIAGLMIAASMFTFGCSGRNADFGTVDMSKIEAEAPIVKTTQEDVTKKMTDLKTQMDKDMEGKTGDDAKKVAEDYGAQNKLKASLDTALKQVSDEKKLGAILDKRAVPQGGTDVTGDVIAKMK